MKPTTTELRQRLIQLLAAHTRALVDATPRARYEAAHAIARLHRHVEFESVLVPWTTRGITSRDYRPWWVAPDGAIYGFAKSGPRRWRLTPPTPRALLLAAKIEAWWATHVPRPRLRSDGSRPEFRDAPGVSADSWTHQPGDDR